MDPRRSAAPGPLASTHRQSGWGSGLMWTPTLLAGAPTAVRAGLSVVSSEICRGTCADVAEAVSGGAGSSYGSNRWLTRGGSRA